MDRKSKVEHQAGDKTANGENRTKEEALGKIHQMEWMRNKKEPWHLARSNSKGENVQEKKKYSKEEDNYFEGTRSQKNKKCRPRHNEGHTQPTHSFSLSTGPCGPPPVNAWSQKKGSALFSKPSEEVDEEDEMLKLALEESLKTAEEDKKRLRERERRLNVEAHSSIRSKVYAEKEYEEDLDEEETYRTSPAGPVFVKQAQTPDLFVVETDPPEDTVSPIAKKKSAPFRARKTSVPRDEYSGAPAVNDFGPKYSQAHEKFPPGRVTNEDNYEVFEPSQPHKRPSPPVSMNNTSYETFEKPKPRERLPPQPCVNDLETSKPTTSYLKPPPKHEANKTIMIPEKDETVSSSVSNLSTSLKSTLTFGDTQGLFENDPTSLPQNCQFELNEKNKSLERATPKPSKTSSIDPAISVETTDTDYMLHRFIRHDPPSSLMTEATPAQIHESSNDMLTLNTSQQFLPSEFEQFEQRQNGLTSQLAMSSNSGRDSSSSMSDSPLQNVSPYGSFEKPIPLGVARGFQMPNPSVPFPFPYPLNVQGNQENVNNLQAMQLTNRNFPSQMPYPSIPPGYIDPNNAIRGMIPLSPQVNQMPGLPQYSNLMMNSLQGQDLRNLNPQLYHHHLHLLAMNAANQYQQQLAALNVHETMDSIQKEQTNTVSQPQMIPNQNEGSTIQAQSQPQLIPPQNQPPVVPIQNLPQMMPVHNQPHDTSSPKQEWFLGEYQQQVSPQNQLEQGMPQNAKSNEELLLRLKYEQTLQTLNQLRQQIAGSQLQSCPIQIPQPQSFAYPTYPMAMGMNNFYPGRPVPAEAHHLNQLVTGTGQASPNTPQDQLNMPGLRNITPELIHTQVPLEPQVGRGRGRIV